MKKHGRSKIVGWCAGHAMAIVAVMFLLFPAVERHILGTRQWLFIKYIFFVPHIRFLAASMEFPANARD